MQRSVFSEKAEWRVHHRPMLWTEVTLESSWPPPEKPDSGLQTGPAFLNHNDPTVNNVHESITPGEFLAPRDPSAGLIQASNLSDSRIIDNSLTSAEKQIFTLIIHSARACVSSPSLPQGEDTLNGCKTQCLNGNEPFSLNILFLLCSPPISHLFPPSLLHFPSTFYLLYWRWFVISCLLRCVRNIRVGIYY